MARQHPRLVLAAALVLAIGVVGAVAGGPRGEKSASLGGWDSAVLVAVKGEPPGSCASALPPKAYLLNSDQWIICGKTGRYRCYRQRYHPLDFKVQAIRPSPFDADCQSALAVLRKAKLVG